MTIWFWLILIVVAVPSLIHEWREFNKPLK